MKCKKCIFTQICIFGSSVGWLVGLPKFLEILWGRKIEQKSGSNVEMTPRPILSSLVSSYQCDQKKIAKFLLKLPKNDFTRKMIDFDTFTKIP